MKRVIPFVFCLLFSFSISAQLELAPRTINRPALLRTDNATDFCLGLQELGILHLSSSRRLGLGTEYTSNGTKLFVNFAKFHLRHNSSGRVKF